MMTLIYTSIMVSSISLIMIFINTIISKKSFLDREKASPFECGFDPKSKARLPFSMHFFIIAVIFLIFDVEITLLMPFIYTMKITNIKMFVSMLVYFLIILVGGVYHEWKQGALSWTK